MPDIALRFHKDMLVVASSLKRALARIGVNTARDTELTLLLEPDIIEDLCKMELVAGAQCVVTPTAGITPARLAHGRMETQASTLAAVAISALRPLNPQHILVEIGPCGLPLDASSKASLNENRDQYKRAAKAFTDLEFDAFFLNGFKRCTDLKCALMGLRQVTGKPVFASVDVTEKGTLARGRETLEDAWNVMNEYEASVGGFCTAADIDSATKLVFRSRAKTNLPVMVSLDVLRRDPRQTCATHENPYFDAETMETAALELRAAGAQFLRAVGDATPAYTGVLAITLMGLDTIDCAREYNDDSKVSKIIDIDELFAETKAKINAAIRPRNKDDKE